MGGLLVGRGDPSTLGRSVALEMRSLGPWGSHRGSEWSENAPNRDVWGQTGAVPGASALVVLPMRSAPAGRVPIYGQNAYVARHRCRVRTSDAHHRRHLRFQGSPRPRWRSGSPHPARAAPRSPWPGGEMSTSPEGPMVSPKSICIAHCTCRGSHLLPQEPRLSLDHGDLGRGCQ